MTTWIGHLRIAQALLPALPHVDEVDFAFGNLGPDSGIPNTDWSAFDPPKEVTHFQLDGGGEDKIHDLVFYRDYLLPLAPDDLRTSYRLGYFVHLLSDNLWSRRVGAASKKAHMAEYLRHGPQFTRQVKWDWYDLDHQYVRDNPESLFWRVILPTPEPAVDLPFLTEQGVQFSLDHIRTFYSTPDPSLDLDRHYPYLSAATMQRYVEDAVTAIRTVLDALATHPTLDGQTTALFLLPAESLAPYPPPLGDPLE
jgi:hypothetical protein